MRYPSLNKTLRLPVEAGLSSLLTGATTLAQTVAKTHDPHLDTILCGALPPGPTELLAGTKLISLLLTAAEKYDQVIIDGPPVVGIADAPILANLATGTLLVVKSDSTRASAAHAAIKRLKTARARLIGGLITYYDARTAGYGYGYGGYYAYGGTPQLQG